MQFYLEHSFHLMLSEKVYHLVHRSAHTKLWGGSNDGIPPIGSFTVCFVLRQKVIRCDFAKRTTKWAIPFVLFEERMSRSCKDRPKFDVKCTI